MSKQYGKSPEDMKQVFNSLCKMMKYVELTYIRGKHKQYYHKYLDIIWTVFVRVITKCNGQPILSMGGILKYQKMHPYGTSWNL